MFLSPSYPSLYETRGRIPLTFVGLIDFPVRHRTSEVTEDREETGKNVRVRGTGVRAHVYKTRSDGRHGSAATGPIRRERQRVAPICWESDVLQSAGKVMCSTGKVMCSTGKVMCSNLLRKWCVRICWESDMVQIWCAPKASTTYNNFTHCLTRPVIAALPV